MADNKKKKGKADRDRVNAGEDYEVRYRSKTLGVSKEKIKKAAKKVGPMVKAVKKALGIGGTSKGSKATKASKSAKVAKAAKGTTKAKAKTSKASKTSKKKK